MDKIEIIIARAMSASKAWPVVFEAGSAAELARAVVVALDAAGFAIVSKNSLAVTCDRAALEAAAMNHHGPIVNIADFTDEQLRAMIGERRNDPRSPPPDRPDRNPRRCLALAGSACAVRSVDAVRSIVTEKRRSVTLKRHRLRLSDLRTTLVVLKESFDA